MRHRYRLTLATMMSAQLLCCQPGAAQSTAKVDFETQVQPIFAKHCYRCHGAEVQESQFRLDIRDGALGAGDSGESPIVAGSSGESPLIDYVSGTNTDLRMPPDGEGERLAERDVEILRSWVDQGATWPDHLSGVATAKMTTDHWSFQPLNDGQPKSPALHAATIANPIDRYVQSRLAEVGLKPSEMADRATLMRRVYLDMLGLPPTMEQVRAFVSDTSPDAYARLVDRVLGSSHYGERWARHWLDVVRFGESTGYEVNRDRPNAFYFRDYVIRSLNHDKPYRDFVIEQIAGDAVGVDVGTGFLVGGPYDMVKSPDVNLTLMQRQDELADMVNTTATAFLGLTVGCARCHNHKFDPILQEDYYAFQAVFSGVQHGERMVRDGMSERFLERLDSVKTQLASAEYRLTKLRKQAASTDLSNVADSGDQLLPISSQINVERFDPIEAAAVRFTIRQTNSGEPCIDELEIYATDSDTNVALADNGAVAVSSGNFPDHPFHRLEHLIDGKHGNSHSWISDTVGKGWVEIQLPNLVSIDRIVWGRDRSQQFTDRVATEYEIQVIAPEDARKIVASSDRRPPFRSEGTPEGAFIRLLPDVDAQAARDVLDTVRALRDQVADLTEQFPVAYVGKFRQPEKTFRLYRGDPMSPREQVAPGALTVTGSLGLAFDHPEQERRLRLAEWIGSENNPLTARVIVNRVWHYHFGKGIVATPSDFGRNGVPPSHPRLLDWLATRLVEHDWSLKWLHKQILNSYTYRQSSSPRPDAMARDMDAQLLWRFPPRRLAAEVIRDCVLFVSSRLNYEAGGPGFLLLRIDHENVHHYFPLREFGADQCRRMIYMMKIRQEQDDVFGVFDCPDGGQVMPNRSRSTTPLQALNLLNSAFMVDQARALADRVRRSAGNDVRTQVQHAFEAVLTRRPTESEFDDAVRLVQQHGIDALCRALLNSNEFLFVS